MVFTVDGVDGPTAFETFALGESDDVVEVNLTFPGETFAESPDPTGLLLSLAETTLDVGTTTAATVTATFEDGTESNVTEVAGLESLDTDVATVSDGAIVGEATGTAEIRAEYTAEGTTVTETRGDRTEGDGGTRERLPLAGRDESHERDTHRRDSDRSLR